MEKVMIRQKCPTCGNYAEVSHGDDGTGCFVPSDKDKVITELERQLKSTQLQRQDYCDALNQIKQKLAEQVAYFEEFKSCLRWGKTYPANPSLELLNNLKADAVREAREVAIKGVFNNWSRPYILLGEYADKLEEGDE